MNRSRDSFHPMQRVGVDVGALPAGGFSTASGVINHVRRRDQRDRKLMPSSFGLALGGA